MANKDAIADLLINAGEPDKDSSTALMVYKGSSLGTSSDAFLGLLDDLTSRATQSNKKEVQDAHRRCIKHVLNSLIQCMFRFEWLALPTNASNFVWLRTLSVKSYLLILIVALPKKQDYPETRLKQLLLNVSAQ
jgi:hypothetical protein